MARVQFNIYPDYNIIGYFTDIWSFGCILYQLLTGRYAFEQVGTNTKKDIVGKILFSDFTSKFNRIQVEPYEYIIKACLNKTTKRPSAEDVLELFTENFLKQIN